MKNNTQVETAQKSQATNKNTSKVPTGKVTLMKETEARKKAREEQYRNFRINALERRCKRMGYDDEKTKEFVEKLKKQLDAPKEYSILIMLNPKDGQIMKEALAKANLKYKYCGDTYFSIDGDQNVLAKIREIAPPSAKIHPYAKKFESVITEAPPKKEKKPTNNTKAKKTAANPKRPRGMAVKSVRHFHRIQKGRYKKLRMISLAAKRAKLHKATTVQLNSKTPSEGSKTLKKAA